MILMVILHAFHIKMDQKLICDAISFLTLKYLKYKMKI
jgi:hypothetical protein